MRIPRRPRRELSREAAELHDAIAGGPRAGAPMLLDESGALRGPFAAMLLAPELGGAVSSLGAALRYRSRLPPRVRELAILTVAAARGSAYERAAHEPIALGLGLSQAQLAAVSSGGLPDLADEESVAVRTARALLDGTGLDDRDFARARNAFGLDGLYELTTLVGYYSMLASQLRVFDLDE